MCVMLIFIVEANNPIVDVPSRGIHAQIFSIASNGIFHQRRPWQLWHSRGILRQPMTGLDVPTQLALTPNATRGSVFRCVESSGSPRWRHGSACCNNQVDQDPQSGPASFVSGYRTSGGDTDRGSTLFGVTCRCVSSCTEVDFMFDTASNQKPRRAPGDDTLPPCGTEHAR